MFLRNIFHFYIVHKDSLSTIDILGLPNKIHKQFMLKVPLLRHTCGMRRRRSAGTDVYELKGPIHFALSNLVNAQCLPIHSCDCETDARYN